MMTRILQGIVFPICTTVEGSLFDDEPQKNRSRLLVLDGLYPHSFVEYQYMWELE